MDFTRLKVTAETYYVRFRTIFKTGVRLFGLGLVLLGVYNMFLVPLFGFQAVAPYRLFAPVINPWRGGYFLGDAIMIGIGAAIAWFV